MNNIYIQPEIKLCIVRSSQIICTSVGGEADPNKPSLGKIMFFDEDFSPIESSSDNIDDELTVVTLEEE